MAELTRLFVWRHLRSETSVHVIHHRSGVRVRGGRGLAFWFLPLTASIAEIPVEDHDLPLLFASRTADHQDVTVQGVVSWRVMDADRLASRVDFTIDLATGKWKQTPMEVVAQRLVELAQQQAHDWIHGVAVEEALREGVVVVRERVADALAKEPALEELGIAVVSVRIATIRPTAELERALQTPTREWIQQAADKATYERRANAVERERAIAENELRNKIELARREEELIEMRGVNERRRVTEEALAKRIEVDAAAERALVQGRSEAETVRVVEGAKVAAEEARIGIYRDLPGHVMLGLAAQQLAGHFPEVGHLTLSPELVGPALTRIADHWSAGK